MAKRIIFSLIAIVTIALGLAWVSSGFTSLQNGFLFLVLVLIGAGALWAGWWAVRAEAPASTALPAWLAWLLIGAALLRLGAGVLWFVALPKWGYGGEAEMAGYVMADAFERDVAAWDLARSDLPLSAAFSEFRGDDQYGGLLFLSAVIYRFLGGEVHQPLQMVVITAAFSALAVLFTWAFARRIWDAHLAALSAWIVALFPEAVLIGGSQMREAFMMTLSMVAFYGLALAWYDHRRIGIGWMLAAFVFCLPLSPLFAVLLALFLVVFALFSSQGRWLKNWRVWLVLLGIVVLVLVVITILGDQLLPSNVSNPLVLLQRWLRQTARLQAIYTRQTSGWMQKVFRVIPKWSQLWFLTGYGVVRPFLPAAIFDSAAPIWQAIAIWRSLGWALMLPFLIAAPFLAWKRQGFRSPEVGLSLMIWVGILVSSFRGGGDQSDNPRYRVAWIGLQAMMTAWVWITQRRDRSPWLRRALVAMGLILIWWVPWYLRRVTSFEWPILNVFVTLGLGFLSTIIYLFFDVWWTKRHSKTADPGELSS
jgi:hypothetical protein